MLRFKDEAEYAAWAAQAGQVASNAPEPQAEVAPTKRHNPRITPDHARTAARILVHFIVILFRLAFGLCRIALAIVLGALQIFTGMARAVLAVLLLVDVAGALGRRHGRGL